MKYVMASIACGLLLAVGLVAAQGADKDKEMTYTGCVAPGKQPGAFMLTNVMMGDGTKKESAAPAAAKDNTPKMLELSSTSVKIEPHSGHKVTVMGKTMTEKSETKMMVTSLKMVSTTCP